MAYTATIGLEIHLALCTKTKIFCACPIDAAAPPNTHVCPVCLGMPGAMPRFNRAVSDCAVRLGLALGCKVHPVSAFDRKSYYYPDNPTSYQITQYERPICTGGAVPIETEKGISSVPLRRIHMEQDAAKLLHRNGQTLIDCNRCGTPLLEIVTEPALHTPEEAAAFLTALREIALHLGISDCKMQAGSLRCDANISLSDGSAPGVPVEIKNLNSVKFLKKALDFEIKRQSECLLRGECIEKQTRRYSEGDGTTVFMRKKETVSEYRYCPEWDLGELCLSPGEIAAQKALLPRLPHAARMHYRTAYGMSEKEAHAMTRYPAVHRFFEECVRLCAPPGLCCALLMQTLFPLLPADEADAKINTEPQELCTVCAMLQSGELSRQNAARLCVLLFAGEKDARALAKAHALCTITDHAVLRAAADAVFAEDPKLLCACRLQKKGALDRALGLALRKTDRRGDATILRSLLQQLFDE